MGETKKFRMPIDGNQLAKRWGVEPLDLAYVMLNHELYFTDFDENKVHILHLIEDVDHLKGLNIPISAYQMDVIENVEKELGVEGKIPLAETIHGSDLMKRWGKAESDIFYLVYQFGLKPVDPFGYPVAEKYVFAMLSDKKVTISELLFLLSDIEEIESQVEGLEPKDSEPEGESETGGKSGGASESGNADEYFFYRRGDNWEIGPVGRKISIRHIQGFDFLHYLLRHPNTEVDVVDLYYLGKVPEEMKEAVAYKVQERTIDKKGRKIIEEKLEDLKLRLDGASDILECEKLESEIERYSKFLGDSNSMYNEKDKARVNVYKNLKRAVDNLLEMAKEYEALKSVPDLITMAKPNATVTAGWNCSYKTLTSQTVSWILDPPS